MFVIKQIRSAANNHIVGGIIATVVGIISQLLAASNSNAADSASSVVVNHIITLAIFGFGFYLLNTVGSAAVYQAMVRGKGSKGQALLRVDVPPKLAPRKYGMNYLTLDVAGMFFAILLVFLVTVLFQNGGGGIPLGGFVGGWLIGSAANQYRFCSKIAEEQIEQGRVFYFNDANIGPRTLITYYQVDPDKDPDKAKEEIKTVESVTALPNFSKKTAVTRRTARIVDSTATVKNKNKAEPLIRTAKKEENNHRSSNKE